MATLVGNLSDITPRTLQMLRGVALVVAGNIYHSIRLSRRFGIEASLAAHHKRNGCEEGGHFISRLQGGGDVVLISDTGTPLIFDPGSHLVRQA